MWRSPFNIARSTASCGDSSTGLQEEIEWTAVNISQGEAAILGIIIRWAHV